MSEYNLMRLLMLHLVAEGLEVWVIFGKAKFHKVEVFHFCPLVVIASSACCRASISKFSLSDLNLFTSTSETFRSAASNF